MTTRGLTKLWLPRHDSSLAPAQESLVAYDPKRYFVPAYVGKAGWIGIALDGRANWDQVAALIEQSYRLVAPRKLAAKLGTVEGD